jgi:hypothetical protein
VHKESDILKCRSLCSVRKQLTLYMLHRQIAERQKLVSKKKENVHPSILHTFRMRILQENWNTFRNIWLIHDKGQNEKMTKESDSSIWVTWSLPYDSTAITPMYNHVVYLLIPSCVAILAQSLYRHRSRYKAVRVCCDTAAVSGLLWGIFLLISFDKPNKTKSAILRNVFAYGIFQAIINYCDAYMFFKVQFLLRHM